jgi:hypothetical protein
MVAWSSALAVALAASLDASAFTVARDGKATCTIVVAADALPAEKTAARELADHLEKVTGATFPLRPTATDGEPAILVGTSPQARALLPDVKWDALGHDGIVVRTHGNQLVLAGGQPRGTLYAVYTFLEDHVGVRWWTSTESFIPKKPTLDVGDLSTVYAPKLVYRETFNEDVLNQKHVHAARMKVNGQHNAIPEDWGGHYTLLGWCHTSYDLLPPAQYFAEHPDWYSFKGGKRDPNGGQLCWTNAAMQKELTRRALQKIRKNPSAGIISISQNDWIGNCECDQCKAIDRAEGSPAASLITGVNAVAAGIAKEYPDFLVETLAYQYTRHAPKTLKPAPNVLVRLCSIECDFTKPLESESNKAFADDLRNWSAVSTNLFVWNYVTNFANYLQPHPNLTPLAADVRFFTANKVVGLFEQGDAYNAGVGDLLPLRCWLLAHLMWDPTRDQDKLIDEFLNGYYGAAGPYLRQYVDLVNSVGKDPAVHLGCYVGDARFMNDAMLAQSDALFAKAADAVKGDETLSRRVRCQRLILDHVHLQRFPFQKRVAALRQSTGSEEAAAEAVAREYKAAASEFCDLAHRHGVANVSEGQAFASYEPGLLMKYEAVVPPKFPKPGEPLPANVVEIQQDRFKLYRSGELSDIVADPKASDGKAARMPGSHGEWAVQFHVPAGDKQFGDGPWRCYLLVRVDATTKTGPAFQYGVHPGSHNWAGLELAGDGEYHAYGMYLKKLSPGQYFWVAPPATGNVNGVYVDRIYLVRDEGK